MAGGVQQDPPPIRLRLGRGLHGAKGQQPGLGLTGGEGFGGRLGGLGLGDERGDVALHAGQRRLKRLGRGNSLRLMGAGAFLVLLGLAAAGPVLFAWGSKADANTAAATGPVPAFVRQGMKITIPEGSPLRTRLVVQPVAAAPVTRQTR